MIILVTLTIFLPGWEYSVEKLLKWNILQLYVDLSLFPCISFLLWLLCSQIADEVDPDHQSDEGIDLIQGKYPQNTALLHHWLLLDTVFISFIKIILNNMKIDVINLGVQLFQ